MNQPAKLSKTGITGWRRVTASDLRTFTENSRTFTFRSEFLARVLECYRSRTAPILSSRLVGAIPDDSVRSLCKQDLPLVARLCARPETGRALRLSCRWPD